MDTDVAPNRLAAAERRCHPRFPNPDVTAAIDGRKVSVVDISVGGMRVEAAGLVAGKSVSITLIARLDGSLRAVKAPAVVVAAGPGQASLAFSSPTYALMQFIVMFLAQRHGVEPHLFR